MAHTPVRGHTLCGTRPLVHVGFMKAWLAGAFNEKVINHVMQLVSRLRSEAHSMKIYVTGHMHLHAHVVLFVLYIYIYIHRIGSIPCTDGFCGRVQRSIVFSVAGKHLSACLARQCATSSTEAIHAPGSMFSSPMWS